MASWGLYQTGESRRPAEEGGGQGSPGQCAQEALGGNAPRGGVVGSGRVGQVAGGKELTEC